MGKRLELQVRYEGTALLASCGSLTIKFTMKAKKRALLGNVYAARKIYAN